MKLSHDILVLVGKHLNRRSFLGFWILDKRLHEAIYDPFLRGNVLKFLKDNRLSTESATRDTPDPPDSKDPDLSDLTNSSSSSSSGYNENVTGYVSPFRGYALPFAITSNRPDMVRHILALAGPLTLKVRHNDPSGAQDPVGQILRVAVIKYAVDSIGVLLEEDVDGIRDGIRVMEDLLGIAVRSNDHEMAKLLLGAGAPTLGPSGRSIAYEVRSASMVRLLEGFGVDLNEGDGGGSLITHVRRPWTPTDFLTALADNLRDIDALSGQYLTTPHERTALGHASSHLNIRAMRTLLGLGAHVGGSHVYEIASRDQGQGNWKGSIPLHDALTQCCLRLGPDHCLWMYHIEEVIQGGDIKNTEDKPNLVYYDMSIFSCRFCRRPETARMSYTMRWAKQLGLFSGRLRAAVEILLSHGAGAYVNVRKETQHASTILLRGWPARERTAFECLMRTVRQIAHSLRGRVAYALSDYEPDNPCHKADVPDGQWLLRSEFRMFFEDFGAVSDLLVEAGAALPSRDAGPGTRGLARLMDQIDRSGEQL